MRIGVLALAIGAVLATTAVRAAEFEFRLAHYLPPTHNQSVNVLPDWIGRIEEQSQGRISIEQFPAGQLLGIQEIFDGVRTGVAEIGWGLPAIQASRFPRTQMLELPFQFTSAEQASRVAMQLADEGLLAGEFDGVELLVLHTHSPAQLHTRLVGAMVPQTLTGLRMRFASPGIRAMLAAYGAEPVGVPAPQVYENLEQGVLDGVAFPYEAMKGLRLGEQVQYHIEVGLYVLPFYLIMNRQAFDGLPDDLQQVILDNSGVDEAVRVGQSWDAEDARGRAYVEELGNEIIVPGTAQRQMWMDAVAPAVDEIIAALEEDGVDAGAIRSRIGALAAQ